MVLVTSRRVLLVVASTAVLLAASSAAAQVVLDAKPMVKVESTESATSRVVLSEPQRTENRITIVKRADRFFWASREDRELLHVTSGAFHYFIDHRGGGYVKVLDSHNLAASVRDPGPRFRYIEHPTLWLGTITYWGASDAFRLDGTQKP